MLNLYEKKEHETAKDYAFRTLLSNIIELKLKPGQKIVESDLCDLIKVSRTPIREAILELSRCQMIDIYPKHGTYVSQIDTVAIKEFISLRTIIESEVTRLACRNVTDEDIDKLRENIALWKYHQDKNNGVKMLELDIEFHKRIYLMADKQFWHNIIMTNAYQFMRLIILLETLDNFSMPFDDHTLIVEALEARNEIKAFTESSSHVNRFYEYKNEIYKQYEDYFKK